MSEGLMGYIASGVTVMLVGVILIVIVLAPLVATFVNQTTAQTALYDSNTRTIYSQYNIFVALTGLLFIIGGMGLIGWGAWRSARE